MVAALRDAICAVSFVDGEAEARAALADRWPGARLVRARRTIRPHAELLRGRLRGRADRPLSLLLRGSPLQLQVWEALLRIPTGRVASYGDVARLAGAPAATRAVASAVADNAIACLIPCHRVIRSTGAFGEYRWGAARKIALLCFGLFLLGAFIWFLPPLAMRVLHPDLKDVWPGLANPQESSYAVAALTVLPNGLIGIMLAAMFSATMSSISGTLNLHASIISRDIFPTLFPRRAGDAERLAVGWTSTFAVGLIIIALAMTMAAQGQSVFKVMLTFNTIMSLAYGPPALLGLVVKRTPYWSGLASFLAALALGSYGTFVLHWELVLNVVYVIPVAVAVFFLSALFPVEDAAHRERREGLFRRLATPVDVRAELGAVADPTTEVFRFISRTTAAVGLLSLLLIGQASPDERPTVLGYVALTLLLAALLSRVRGRDVPASVPVKP